MQDLGGAEGGRKGGHSGGDFKCSPAAERLNEGLHVVIVIDINIIITAVQRSSPSTQRNSLSARVHCAPPISRISALVRGPWVRSGCPSALTNAPPRMCSSAKVSPKRSTGAAIVPRTSSGIFATNCSEFARQGSEFARQGSEFARQGSEFASQGRVNSPVRGANSPLREVNSPVRGE
eukprot:1184767-Prorocentrum_minimum.AAC.1